MSVSRKVCRKWLKVVSMVVGAGLFSSPVLAELWAIPSGRTANIASQPDRSVEGGFVTGDDYQYLGGRFNFKFSPEAVLFVDVGNGELGDSVSFDGMTFGAGVFYQIQGLMAGFDTAVKASYHAGELEYRSFSVDVSSLSFEGLISGTSVGDTDFGWYANIGVHMLEADGAGTSGDDTEIGFGGGVVLPISVGEVFFGVDHIDDLFIGGGLRYAF